MPATLLEPAGCKWVMHVPTPKNTPATFACSTQAMLWMDEWVGLGAQMQVNLRATTPRWLWRTHLALQPSLLAGLQREQWAPPPEA